MFSTDVAREISDWLVEDGRLLEMSALVESLGYRLFEAGMPIARMTVSYGLLNPSMLAAGIVWRPDRGLDFTRYAYSERDNGMYERSPFKVAYEENRWVDIDLSETADATYDIVAELKSEGLRRYIVVPMLDTVGRRISMTFASRGEFDDAHRALIRGIIPAVRTVVEIKVVRKMLGDVTAAYVGRTPAREILSGAVHRGQVTEVRAAILVADLRGFTRLSTRLPPAATAEVINRYYDIVVPPIEAAAGEVLKFIGDAVLALFPVERHGEEKAVLAALGAARAARDAKSPPFEMGGETVSIRFGTAIHFGEAVYGNVGSGDRLDFTVIGRDVNIAARIASLCSRLGRDFLVSEAVAAVARRHGYSVADAGAHEVRGLAMPLPVFVPDVDTPPSPPAQDGHALGLALVPASL